MANDSDWQRRSDEWVKAMGKSCREKELKSKFKNERNTPVKSAAANKVPNDVRRPTNVIAIAKQTAAVTAKPALS